MGEQGKRHLIDLKEGEFLMVVHCKKNTSSRAIYIFILFVLLISSLHQGSSVFSPKHGCYCCTWRKRKVLHCREQVTPQVVSLNETSFPISVFPHQAEQLVADTVTPGDTFFGNKQTCSCGFKVFPLTSFNQNWTGVFCSFREPFSLFLV